MGEWPYCSAGKEGNNSSHWSYLLYVTFFKLLFKKVDIDILLTYCSCWPFFPIYFIQHYWKGFHYFIYQKRRKNLVLNKSRTRFYSSYYLFTTFLFG